MIILSSLVFLNDYYRLLQAQHKQSNQLAAAKMCALEGEDDLSDFMIEIDILSECKHPNIVELHEAYFIEGKLWVCVTFYFVFFSFYKNSFSIRYKLINQIMVSDIIK